ncbi:MULTISPECIES: gamma-glutamyl-gamma-aminobutyrate hydrolase family protein [Streptomyces]|uniref:Peptidase C26 n=4 Tax=Streptomyces TaxID=1883 RepID=A0A5P2BNV9_STRVZ|nr:MULTISPECIES: gamma-glutamyl-gamma-aminobutyrate hydrolase family protein [Streptomyces]MYZ15052.1 gamma-glutamyl-gamma-aminobutyrate hydrolase family protein [Streptomyces sp. SID337]NEB43802.1 gamma-glutamyl-gamma-aminobutyrate hydrolase family protein [Streptomyces sp. SID339]QES31418.1 peptidase C26 [Streptomyces venezuelae]
MPRPARARPLIALPQRYAATTSALRYAAVVTARALADAVYRAGGEPFMMHPGPPDEAAERLARCAGLLLPGGGDVAPWRYATGAGAGAAGAGTEVEVHGAVYDVDDAQDDFDLALARCALSRGLPTLAVCRGMQVVNVALGGTLRQDMGGPAAEHRHKVHAVRVAAGSVVGRTLGATRADVSCYHHQCVELPGRGLAPSAWAADGTIEALELPDGRGWFAAVQWHPEDTATADAGQQGLFGGLVRAAGAWTERDAWVS